MKKSALFFENGFHLLILITFFSFDSIAQMRPLSLNSKTQLSTYIVEGRVINKHCFRSEGNIYTANQIELYKIFKGTLSKTFIEIITPGGTIGLNKELVTPSLKLNIGDVGMFLFKKTMLGFEPIASKQSFYKYDLEKNHAYGIFENFYDIKNNLYNRVVTETKRAYRDIQKFDVEKTSNTQKANFNKIMSITTFNPTTITAGTASQLTIYGSSFGSSKGTVSFANVDDGGVTFIDALDAQVLNWSDTEITVEVPSNAGTGKVRVTTTTPTIFDSSTDLNITYSEVNVIYDGGSGNNAYKTQHIGDNGFGGYTWQMFTDFDANASANASFVRALDKWRCETGVNWIIGTTTSTDVIAADGINVIRFDNGSELPVGNIGRCTSRYTGCGSGINLDWYVSELDIVFDDGTNWEYGETFPSTGEYDFETVAIHELGHGHQLNHVNDGSDLMFWAVSSGTHNRILNANNLLAATDVQSRNTSTVVCLQSLMTTHNCDALSFSASSYNVDETTSAFDITVIRTGSSVGATSVDYSVTGGTATGSGTDYTVSSGTLNWSDGDTSSKTFSVTIVNDSNFEGDETINFLLSNFIGTGSGIYTTTTLNILDDERILAPYTNDFNTDNGNFKSVVLSGTGGQWEWGAGDTGKPNFNPNNSAQTIEGAANWMTNLSTHHGFNTIYTLETPSISLVGGTGDYNLEFDYRGAVGPDAGMNIDYSTDGGSTWQILGIFGDSNATNWYTNTSISGLGNEAGWYQVSFTIFYPTYKINFLIGESNIKFRFVFGASSNALDGFQIDNFEITGNATTLGIDDSPELAGSKLYPNPVSGFLFIELPITEELDVIEVYDMNGRKVKQFKSDGYKNSVDLSGLNSGIYIVKLFSVKNHKLSKKIIVK